VWRGRGEAAGFNERVKTGNRHHDFVEAFPHGGTLHHKNLLYESKSPFIRLLVQNRLPASLILAGQLSRRMLGKLQRIGNREGVVKLAVELPASFVTLRFNSSLPALTKDFIKARG